jgi:hypothetical protein
MCSTKPWFEANETIIMATVRFPLRRYRSHTIGSHELHLEQFIALFRVVGQKQPYVVREAVVDTGASMSVFPQKEWELFEGINWLTQLNDPALPKWCRRFRGVAGGSFSFRFGTVSIEFYDHLRGRVGPLKIVGMFAFDNGQMRDILLGLGGGTFSKRRLEMDYDAQSILLSDK